MRNLSGTSGLGHAKFSYRISEDGPSLKIMSPTSSVIGTSFVICSYRQLMNVYTVFLPLSLVFEHIKYVFVVSL